MVIYKNIFRCLQMCTLRKYFRFETAKLYMVPVKPSIPGGRGEIKTYTNAEEIILDPKMMESTKTKA